MKRKPRGASPEKLVKAVREAMRAHFTEDNLENVFEVLEYQGLRLSDKVRGVVKAELRSAADLYHRMCLCPPLPAGEVREAMKEISRTSSRLCRLLARNSAAAEVLFREMAPLAFSGRIEPRSVAGLFEREARAAQLRIRFEWMLFQVAVRSRVHGVQRATRGRPGNRARRVFCWFALRVYQELGMKLPSQSRPGRWRGISGAFEFMDAVLELVGVKMDPRHLIVLVKKCLASGNLLSR